MREIDITEDCLNFIDQQEEKTKLKIFYLIEIIGEIKIVNSNFLKKLQSTQFYELRVKTGKEIRIIIFAVDHLNFAECKKAVMGKSVNARELISARYGEKGSKEREQFREEAFSYYFGEVIRNRRKELGMSQEGLADKIGKKRPYISRIEKGEDIKLSNFALLANALGLTIELKAEEV